MEIRGNKPAEGSEARRFSAGKAAPKPGAKSFGAVLKQAAAGSGPAPAPVEPPREAAASAQASAADPEKTTEGASAQAAPPAPASAETSFADHMEMVRFRLKTGYYASKAIDDALTDKLSGYFDELG
jgi:hypothetical protein